MNKSSFKDFVVCKALDVISGNCAYRKYLHKCSENGEKWAVEVCMDSVFLFRQRVVLFC
jgi:hypothetical protein